MKRTIQSMIIFAFVAVALNSSTISAQVKSIDSSKPSRQMSPDALVRDLYKVHGQKNSRILAGKSRVILDRYFDKNLADLMWKDLTAHRDEVGVIDFDPFYNAQDFQIKNLSVGQAKIEASKASVPVSFTNYTAKESITYLLVKQNDSWKIADIKYKNGDTLLKYFREDSQNKTGTKN